MIKRLILPFVILLAVAVAIAGWMLTAPQRLSQDEVAALTPGDAVRGERIFWAGGCESCHARPGAEGAAQLELAGGVELGSPFGTFVAPNISQDPKDGIGSWSVEDLANAMKRGVSPDGRHYFPAFPYTSYTRMAPGDISDLYAFLKTLPAVSGKAPDHKVGFPFNIRRGVGLWKKLYMKPDPVIELAHDASDQLKLGRYLTEGPAHCGECHTPRNVIGGLQTSKWLAGAASAEGAGNAPNITGGEGGIGEWSEQDIAYFLESGFTPEYDSVGGSMAAVQRNMSKLTPEDRAAIAAYLKAVPAQARGY
jgi:mono/diheme cytochrome c family protein